MLEYNIIIFMKEQKKNKAENKRYTKVGPYILTEEIGKGAFSVVYGAKKQGQKSRYAVKQITLTNLKPRQLQRIHSEISVLTNIKHKNIVNLVDYKQTSRNLYLIFEFCKHTDLSVYVEKYCDGKMPEEKVRKIGIQIKKAFQVLRQHKIVHRDLKLANILITEDFQIKIADFGFARHLDNNQFFDSYVGTPLTMAPEIMENNRTYNEKCDLWSLGIIFYELLFGKNPFFSKTKMSAQQIKNATNAQLKIPQPISPEAEDLLRRLIKTCPNERISFQQFFKHPWLMQNHQISELNEDLLEQSLRNQLKNSLMATVRKKQEKQFLMKNAQLLLAYQIIQNVKNLVQAKFMLWINLGKKVMGLEYKNLRLSFLAISVLMQNIDKFQKCMYGININQDKKITFPKYEQMRKLQKWQMSEYTKRLPGFISRSLQKMSSFLKEHEAQLQFTKSQKNTPLSQLYLYELTSEIALRLQNQQEYQNINTFIKIRPLIVAPHLNLRITSALFNQNTIDLLLKKAKLNIENNRMYKVCYGVFKIQTQYREEPGDRIYENFKQVLQ